MLRARTGRPAGGEAGWRIPGSRKGADRLEEAVHILRPGGIPAPGAAGLDPARAQLLHRDHAGLQQRQGSGEVPVLVVGPAQVRDRWHQLAQVAEMVDDAREAREATARVLLAGPPADWLLRHWQPCASVGPPSIGRRVRGSRLAADPLRSHGPHADPDRSRGTCFVPANRSAWRHSDDPTNPAFTASGRRSVGRRGRATAADYVAHHPAPAAWTLPAPARRIQPPIFPGPILSNCHALTQLTLHVARPTGGVPAASGPALGLAPVSPAPGPAPAPSQAATPTRDTSPTVTAVKTEIQCVVRPMTVRHFRRPSVRSLAAAAARGAAR